MKTTSARRGRPAREGMAALPAVTEETREMGQDAPRTNL